MINYEGILYAIENEKNGRAKVVDEKKLKYEDLNIAGWKVKQITLDGMLIKIYHVAPNAINSEHVSPVDEVCVVSDGYGELFLTDEEGKETSVIMCKKGDVYFQGANTLHGFRNGQKETVLIYIENLHNKNQSGL